MQIRTPRISRTIYRTDIDGAHGSRVADTEGRSDRERWERYEGDGAHEAEEEDGEIDVTAFSRPFRSAEIGMARTRGLPQIISSHLADRLEMRA